MNSKNCSTAALAVGAILVIGLLLRYYQLAMQTQEVKEITRNSTTTGRQRRNHHQEVRQLLKIIQYLGETEAQVAVVPQADRPRW